MTLGLAFALGIVFGFAVLVAVIFAASPVSAHGHQPTEGGGPKHPPWGGGAIRKENHNPRPKILVRPTKPPPRPPRKRTCQHCGKTP